MKQSSVYVSLFLFAAMVLGLFSFGLPRSAVQAAQASPTPQATDSTGGLQREPHH